MGNYAAARCAQVLVAEKRLWRSLGMKLLALGLGMAASATIMIGYAGGI